MCEIILIILLCRHIAHLADEKGQGGIAILFVGGFVVLWISGEAFGAMIGYLITGELIGAYASGFVGAMIGATIGYLVVLIWPSYQEPDRRGGRRRSQGISSSSTMILLFTVLGGVAFIFLAVILIVAIWFIRKQFVPEPRPRAEVDLPEAVQPIVPEIPPPIDRPPPEPWKPPVELPNPLPPINKNPSPAIDAMRAGKFLKPDAAPAPTTYLLVESTAGDYIGQGKTYSYPNAKMSVRPDGGGLGVQVDVEGWSISFGGSGKQPLNVGEYRNARRNTLRNQFPGLDFSGMGRGSNQVSGEFTVWQLENDGAQITRLAVDFVQRSENTGPPLFGVLRYNSTLR